MDGKILSIQSHVVSGYVGNKCAVFALQVLGFEVDAINSVQLSNHTGYQVFKGHTLDASDLRSLIEGLSNNNIDNYSYLLTGYARNVLFLEQIVDVVHHLKKKNPDLIYVCDPVMGDDGVIYIPKELIPIYRNKIIPLADIIMPNKSELEWLLENNIVNDMETILNGIQKLHEKGCKVVVVTSAEFTPGILTVIASSIWGNKRKIATVEIKKIGAHFYGTGDLFGALFLAWMAKTERDIVVALENTVNTLYAVISRTYAHAQNVANDNENEKLELKLIQSKCDIENPKILFKAKIL